jgi:hemerythrin superfamily protein
VARALEEFESAAGQARQSIAERICKLLTVHSQLEEELLYPAAREALRAGDAHLVAEANVEHASVKDLIEQIQGLGTVDEQYEAKVTVLGEYVRHHVGEEERELFPKLERTSLDLESLGERLATRKRELMGMEGMEDESREAGDDEAPAAPGRGRSTGRAHRPGFLQARRR